MRKNVIFIALFRPESLIEKKSALFSIVVTGVVRITGNAKIATTPVTTIENKADFFSIKLSGLNKALKITFFLI